MKKTGFAVAALAVVAFAVPAVAQTAPNTVDFTMSAIMDSLHDSSNKDTFSVGLADAQIVTSFEINCTAGQRRWAVFATNEECSVAGNGRVLNNGQQLPRTQYAGGFTVGSDGRVEMRTLMVNYLALGQVAASNSAFSGNMNMTPENPSQGAADIFNVVMEYAEETAGVGGESVIDDRFDSVEFSRVFIPGAGLPSDQGCTWSGDMIYAYQTESWVMRFTGVCDGVEYNLSGNMPWVDIDKETAQYNLTLTLPSATLGTDDALFASTDADADLFATIDGIAGTIMMEQSDEVIVEVDGAPEELFAEIEATGSFTGTNVPLEVVRSFATLFAINARTFFGA